MEGIVDVSCKFTLELTLLLKLKMTPSIECAIHRRLLETSDLVKVSVPGQSSSCNVNRPTVTPVVNVKLDDVLNRIHLPPLGT